MCRWIDAIISDRLLFSNSNPEKKMCCRISFGKQTLKMNRRLHLHASGSNVTQPAHTGNDQFGVHTWSLTEHLETKLGSAQQAMECIMIGVMPRARK